MAEIQYLTFEDGIVTIGGQELPGLLLQLTIAGQVKFDEAETDGQSGKKKVPMGYEDATINIDLELLTDEDGTCYDKLTAIEKIYKDVGPNAAPKILDVVNRHMRARSVGQVVFSGFSSRESNQDDMILAALTFTEHLPAVTTAEKRVVGGNLKKQAGGGSGGGGGGGGGGSKSPPANPDEKKLNIDLR